MWDVEKCQVIYKYGCKELLHNWVNYWFFKALHHITNWLLAQLCQNQESLAVNSLQSLSENRAMALRLQHFNFSNPSYSRKNYFYCKILPYNKWNRKNQGSTQNISADRRMQWKCRKGSLFLRSAAYEDPKQRYWDMVPFQTYCSDKTRESFGHRQVLKQFDSTMGPTSHAQLTLKERVSVLRIKTSSPMPCKTVSE